MKCSAGTFLAWERVAALYQFVRDSLENGWQPFELMAPGGQKLKDDEELALNEYNLVSQVQTKQSTMFNSIQNAQYLNRTFVFTLQAPAALLTFSWDAAVLADIAAAGGKTAVLLKAALLENIKTLSWMFSLPSHCCPRLRSPASFSSIVHHNPTVSQDGPDALIVSTACARCIYMVLNAGVFPVSDVMRSVSTLWANFQTICPIIMNCCLR